MLRRLVRSWRRSSGDRGLLAAASPSRSLAAEAASTGRSLSDWVRNLVISTRLYVDPANIRVQRLRSSEPELAASTVAAAERVLRHEFDLLGSAPFVPVDPDRQPRPGYSPIDWYLDPVRRLRFPRNIHYREWKLYEMRPANADVKLPWELARCQHWVTLGQAFRLTGDERFAAEIAFELDDFVEASPVGVGIHWTCTMDVALRAVNWALGLELVKNSGRLDAAFWDRAYQALFDHGTFIRGNLENTYEVTSNHFLCNVVGLWFLGAVFTDLPDGQAWQTFAKQSLEREIDVQVLPDGADFESSVPYHRLVAELFLGCARLGEAIGQPLSAHYTSRVRDMVAYLADVVRPDGLMPQVGDADDGRLHIFSGYGSTTPQDPRHLFGPAAVMFNEPHWLALAGEVGSWELAWWGLDADLVNRMSSSPQPHSHLYPDAGMAVMRGADNHYLLVTNGMVGTKGFGNHKHNDQLSFEYHYRGVPFVVDPGSYVYTSDASARNTFRGTASHSTLCVDQVEQNEMNPEWLFRLLESARAEHVAFVDAADRVEYTGRHHGYERLGHPLTHERTITLAKATGTVTIADRAIGAGDHALRWHFHLAPGIAANRLDDTSVALTDGDARLRLRGPGGLVCSIVPAEYSPSYGVKVPCAAVEFLARVTIDGAQSWTFTIEAA